MSFSRAALLAVSCFCLSSCQTFHGFMNSFPVRMLDGVGSQAMSLFGEASPDSKVPATMEDRARQVESRGLYAGHSRPVVAPRQNMAAR